MNINGINIAAELVDFLLALAILYMATVSRPRKTVVFSVVYSGLIVSVVNIILHTLTAVLATVSPISHSFLYELILAAYYLTYLAILLLLFSYIHLLALKQRENLGSLAAVIISFSIVYLFVTSVVFVYDVISPTAVLGDGLSRFYNINIAFGMADTIMVFFSAVHNRDGIPRVILQYILLFSPFEMALLVLQILKPDTLFLSVTYVLPLVFYYIVFHSILFDETTGCQNKQAFKTHYSTLIKKVDHFCIIYVKFPRLGQVNSHQILSSMKRRISGYCRALERKNYTARIYMLDEGTFSLAFNVRTEEDCRATINFVRENLDKAMEEWSFSNNPEYKMIVIREDPLLSDMPHLDSLSKFLFDMADKKKVNFYEATAEDYRNSQLHHLIEKEIVDIRNKDDLNDERVKVLIQPIYDVAKNNYHSAEALMRLELNGEIIRPDVFIPIAERTGCIHSLTRIILNKVCQKIYAIQDYYDFDAISVNVSLSEFMDYCLHDELIDIIEKNGVPCSKIRLEITESMTSDEMDAIAHNMREFNAAGVQFYLDDFGTGYSNLERIVSLPFRTIKFDKSILYKSLADPILLQLISNMVDTFKTHNLIVLVEGVETKEQADLSKELGFQYIQGFNYATPVPIADIGDYFENKKMRLA